LVGCVVAAVFCGGCSGRPVPHRLGSSATPAASLAEPSASFHQPSAPAGGHVGAATATAATGSAPRAAAGAVAVIGTRSVPCPGEPWVHAVWRPAVPIRVRAVVRCITVQRDYRGLGEWNVELAEVTESDLLPFLSALANPPPMSSTAAACPANEYLAPSFALVTGDGHLSQPGFTAGICGWPEPSVLTQFQQLDFHVVDAARTIQIASDATSPANGCPLRWKDMVAAAGDRFGHGPVVTHADRSAPSGLGEGATGRLCAYRAGPVTHGYRTGSLIAGAPLPDTRLATLAEGFSVPNTFYTCDADAATFATLTFDGGDDPGGVAYLEIDGCNRALDTHGNFEIGGNFVTGRHGTSTLVDEIKRLLHLS
jgi:hypothetical protein